MTEQGMALGLPTKNSRLCLQAALAATGRRVLAIGQVEPGLASAMAASGARVTYAASGSPADGAPHPDTARVPVGPRGLDYLAAFGPEAFDTILIPADICTLTGPVKLLRAAARTLAPGGRVVLSARNAGHGSLRLAALALGVPPGGPPSTPPTMTWRTLTGLVAQAGLEIAEASAVIVDPLEGPGLDLPADLPRETLDWLCSQPGAYELDYVVAAVPAGEGQGAVPIAPTPAGPLPDRAATPRPRDGDPLARIERLTALALDHLERQELRSRDGAIGAEASAASARRDLERASVQFHRQVRELRTDYQKREARLRRDLAQRIAEERRATARRYERSTTWRIGRLATAPIRAIRRLVRRR